MAIGFNFYFMAIIAIAFAVFVPRIHHISKIKDVAEDSMPAKKRNHSEA
jgi:hypothetical protein